MQPSRMCRFLLTAAAAASVALAACESGTEPLDPARLVGVHPLILIDGYNLPIDVWFSGDLTLRADSTYRIITNGTTYDEGRWTVRGDSILVTSAREPQWVGLIQPHSILFPKDNVHYNNFVFDE